MSEQKNEKWLDELISRTINSGKPQFDAETWKQRYPEEFQMLKSRAAQGHRGLEAGIWARAIRSKITKFAAAAVIILAIGFFVSHRTPSEQIDNRAGLELTKSPAELMTAMSLNLAYRKGGMEAVEKQCDKAFELLGPRPESLSIRQLLAEFNGT